MRLFVAARAQLAPLVTPFVAPLAVAVLATSAAADTFEYAAEDGGNSNVWLSQFDANVTWGNVFFAEPGAEQIVTVRLTLADEFADAGRSLEVLIYEDPDDAAPTFDPARAVLISRTTTTAILTPDDEPADYAIEPTVVEGRFFVAVNMDAFQDERVFRQDYFEPGVSSWTFYNPVGTPQLDLGASKFIGNNVGFGVGTWVVRAIGCPAQPGCNGADIAEPFGVLDLGDLQAFVAGFLSQDPIADITGEGVFDLADVQAFVSAFTAGCG